jgi:hypothetical protein
MMCQCYETQLGREVRCNPSGPARLQRPYSGSPATDDQPAAADWTRGQGFEPDAVRGLLAVTPDGAPSRGAAPHGGPFRGHPDPD